MHSPLCPHSPQDHAVAGFGAGTVATLVMHPLDLVKVRFQLSTDPYAAAGQAGSSSTTPRRIPRLGTAVYRALDDTVRQDGWRGLYRGLVPNLVGGASSWGLYFLLCVDWQSAKPLYLGSCQI